MTKVKELIKNKKFLIIFSIGLVFIISLIIFLIAFNRESKSLMETNYTAYLISKNSVILDIEFKESYYECVKNSQKRICSDKKTEVTNTDVLIDGVNINNLVSLDLKDVITTFINDLSDDNIDISDLSIVSDYKFSDEFIDSVTKNLNREINIKLDYQENIEDFNPEVNYYTITFDTAGGSSIDSIVVEENSLITKPADPTKEGYSFGGWYINDEEVNFEDLVKSDLTLVAKWEKNKTNSSSSSSTSEPNTITSNKINLNNNLSATVYYKSTGRLECFFYMFVNNLNEVYPKVTYSNFANNIKKYDMWVGPEEDASESEMSNSKFENSGLTFDTSKENKLKNTFEKYKNGIGIKVNSYGISDHKISFDYEYITFNGLNVADGTNANKEIQNILSGSSLFQGACGGYDYEENVTVDETICEKFNLDCDRW